MQKMRNNFNVTNSCIEQIRMINSSVRCFFLKKTRNRICIYSLFLTLFSLFYVYTIRNAFSKHLSPNQKCYFSFLFFTFG